MYAPKKTPNHINPFIKKNKNPIIPILLIQSIQFVSFYIKKVDFINKYILYKNNFITMKYIKTFEGLFSWLSGDKVSDASHDSLRGKGFSHRGKDEKNYIMFNGQKFYDEDIEYADYQDLGEIPRIERGKLIIANPNWSN